MRVAKREYGSGSVYQRSSDDRWIGTLEAGWKPDGSRRRITVSAKTRPEVLRRLRDKRNQLEAGGVTDANPRVNVKQWADQWLATAQATVRPETYTSHASAVKRWIVPVLGQKKLSALTPADVRALDQAQVKAGRASSTSLRTHAVLMTMLRAAIVDGHRVPPRILEMRRPPKGTSDRDALTVEQATAVLDVASTMADGSRWVAALLQGMRQGECLGLTWEAIDFDAGLIDVSWQLQTIPYADRRRGEFRVPRDYERRRLTGSWHLVRPKTQRGQRLIPLVPWMASALETWRPTAPENPWGLVWPRPDGRPAVDKEDSAAWKELQAKAKVAHPSGRLFHLHEARNTTATLLLEAGVDPEVIKAILGHSSIVTSRSYMSVSETLTRQAMERVAERLRLTAT